MEMRFQSKQTGISTWLVEMAVGNALSHEGSENLLICDTKKSRKSPYEIFFSMSTERELVFKEMSSHAETTFVRLENDSVLLFSDQLQYFQHPRKKDSFFTDWNGTVNPTKKRYVYLDNVSSYFVPEKQWDEFVGISDFYYGANFYAKGEFMCECDWKDFFRENSDRMGDAISGISNFIYEEVFLNKDNGIVTIPPTHGEFCLPCKFRNDFCVRLGDVFMVGKDCPYYSEILVTSLNQDEESVVRA